MEQAPESAGAEAGHEEQEQRAESSAEVRKMAS